MSNTLTNVKDIKVAQRALQPFMANLMPVSAFSIDFSPLPADKLDTVRVPLVGAPSESSDFAGDYSANADSTVTVVPVVLNRHKYKTIHVTARESAETALNVLETLVEAAAQQLAQDVLLDIFTEITAANYGAPGIPALAATNFDYKKVLNLRESCGNAKMPPNPRALVLDAGYYTNLLADDVVAKSFNLNLNAPAVTEGMVKRLAGFALHETTIIPPDHAEKLVGFAAHSSAMAVAMRYLQPVADYQQAGAVTDPQTGMTFGYLRFTDTGLEVVSRVVEANQAYSPSPSDILSYISSYHLGSDADQAAALTILVDYNYFGAGYTVADLVDAFLVAHFDAAIRQIRWLVIERSDTGSGTLGDFRISNSSSIDVHWDNSSGPLYLTEDSVVRVQILDSIDSPRVQAIVEYIGSLPGGGSSSSY